MQVVWLKVELCRLLDEKRSAVLRLIIYIMSMVFKFCNLRFAVDCEIEAMSFLLLVADLLLTCSLPLLYIDIS